MTARQAHEMDVEARLKAECAKCKNTDCPNHGRQVTAITEADSKSA